MDSFNKQPAHDKPPVDFDWERYLLDMTVQRTRPKTRLRINGTDTVYSGAITLVGGDRKQGKSQTLVIMAAAMMSRRAFGAVAPGEAETGTVLWIDTEQNDWFQSCNVRRLYSLMGVEPDTPTRDVNLYYLGLFGLTAVDQYNALVAATAKLDPSLLVIDQLGDLAVDTNDNIESAQLMGALLELTRDHPDMAIVTALHNNPGSDKARGHIGSELERKCAEKWVPKRGEDETFTVKCAFSRGKVPDDWGFRFDASGMLVPTDVTAKSLDDLTIDDIVPGVGIKFSAAVDRIMGLVGCKSLSHNNPERRKYSEWLNERVSLWEAMGRVMMEKKFIAKVNDNHRTI